MTNSGLAVRLPQTVAAMEALLDHAVGSGAFAALSRRLIAGAGRQAQRALDGFGWAPHIDLAFDVTEACGGDPALAVPLAAASAFVFSGMDVLDDLADGDTQEQWQGVAPAQRQLAGIAALASYPPMLISRLPLPADRVLAMLALYSRRLLAAGIGQHADLTLAGADRPAPETAEAAAAGKSGEQVALYCEWAALAAGADGESVAAWGDFGRALGTAGQIRSDMRELCHDRWCRDLASGNRTLPLACHIARLAPAARAGFLALLDRARSEADAQAEVRRLVRDSGALRLAALVAHMHASRARPALERAGAREPAKSRLLATLQSHPAASHPAAAAACYEGGGA